jgi:hypothetical protein
VAESAGYRALERAGLVHPAAGLSGAAPVRAHPEFFGSLDRVQVKYEMRRAQVIDGQTASRAAQAHGYSRAAFCVVWAGVERSGLVGLVDERPGRRGPVKLSPEVLACWGRAGASVPAPGAPSWPGKWRLGGGSGCTGARWRRRSGV